MYDLYDVLARVIARHDTANMPDKLDLFLAAGKITLEQYGKLSAMLTPEGA